jgi:hypothetical protein
MQTKVSEMTMVFYCTKLQSKVNYIKLNMNFYFQLASTFIFLVSHKNCLNKSCSFFIYQPTDADHSVSAETLLQSGKN